jgi:hypothetical protein
MPVLTWELWLARQVVVDKPGLVSGPVIPYRLFAAMSVDSANNPLPPTMRLTSPQTLTV